MHVRPIEPRELDALADLFVASYADPWTREEARAYLGRLLRFDPECCLAATDDAGALVGAVIAWSYPRKRDVVLFVQEIFVSPAARGKGCGRALLTALRGRFAENPKINVKPLVKAGNDVLRFYNSLGIDRVPGASSFVFWEE